MREFVSCTVLRTLYTTTMASAFRYCCLFYVCQAKEDVEYHMSASNQGSCAAAYCKRDATQFY